MPDPVRIWRAGATRRWHTNPDLCDTIDRIDGHGARVARLILVLHPEPTMDLICAALIHDDGESEVGDMKAPLKDAAPVIADALAEMESIFRVTIWGEWARDIDDPWIKFADRLDAYMWARHHRPDIMDSDGWPGARTALWKMGIALGVDSVVLGRALNLEVAS